MAALGAVKIFYHATASQEGVKNWKLSIFLCIFHWLVNYMSSYLVYIFLIIMYKMFFNVHFTMHAKHMHI